MTNLTTGLATANCEGDPIVALGGNVPVAQRYKATHQVGLGGAGVGWSGMSLPGPGQWGTCAQLAAALQAHPPPPPTTTRSLPLRQGLDNVAILKPVTKFAEEVPAADCISEASLACWLTAALASGGCFITLAAGVTGGEGGSRGGWVLDPETPKRL